jgi:hypothetical protein
MAVVFNGAFFFLSNLYAADRPDEVDLGKVRLAFGVLTAVVGLASFVAAISPRLIGHGLAVVLGIGAFIAGIGAISRDLPGVMCATLLVVGCLLPVLAYFSWRHSRAAWSYLISLLAVVATVTLFGAPKVRVQLGVGLWTALIIPGVTTVAMIAVAMLRGEYRDP